MLKYVFYALVASAISACGGGGGGGGGGSTGGSGGGSGGGTPPPPPPPAPVVNKLGGEVAIATGFNGAYTTGSYFSDAGGMSEPKEVGTYTISKGHLIELSGLSRDGNDITYDVKSMRAELADGDFVEFGILPTGDGASLRILVFGSDGFIRDNQRIDGSQTTYRYTHSGGDEGLIFDLQPVGTLGAEVAFRAGHTVPVPASNQTVSKSNSQNSIKTEPKQDIEFTAVARDPNGGWVDLYSRRIHRQRSKRQLH